MENKKGFTTLMLIFVVFFAIALLIFLAVLSLLFSTMDIQISQLDFMIGNQSFNETYQSLVHPGMVSLSVTVPRNISIGTLIGMVLVMLLVGMKSPRRSKLWIILDIFIIIVAEIVAVAIKITFENEILNLTPELFIIFSNTLAESSKWILNLPTIIPTLGALIILATYVLRREDREDETGGFSQIENE